MADESAEEAPGVVDVDDPAVPAPASHDGVGAARARRSRGLLPWVASIAAAVVLSVVATTLIVGIRVDDRLTALDHQIEGLETVTLATIDITAEPDTQRVALTSTAGDPASGNLLYSPSTVQLVVVASGLTEPPAGQEYRCWVEVDGTRTSIGKMFFSNDLAYWVGPAPSIAGVDEGAQFGVSLTTVGSPSAPSPPVLAGQILADYDARGGLTGAAGSDSVAVVARGPVADVAMAGTSGSGTGTASGGGAAR